MADEIKQTIVIEANIATIQNDIKTLENDFKTSFANIGAAGIESFASIDAASRKFRADQAATAAAVNTVAPGGFKNISTLAAANLAGAAPRAPSATTGVKSDAAEFARFEKIRQDALTASRAAFKDFEDSVRAGSKNVNSSLAESATSASGLTSSMGSLLAVAKSVGLVFSVGFAVGFIKEAFNATGALNNLADQTGFTGETLLKLKPIANDTGSSIEDFARSVNQFQKAVIEGSPATVEALHKIGLTANELLKFADDPEGLIGKLSKGLASIADQATRVQVTRNLLARGGPQLAAAFAGIEKRGGIEGIQAEKPLVTSEQIAAINSVTAAFDRAKISLEALAAVRILEVFDLFVKIGKAVDLVIDKIDKLREKLPAFGPTREDVAALIAQNKAASEVPASPQAELEAAKQSTTFRNFPAPISARPIDLSKATFGTPSEIAKLSVGPQETDNQIQFKKSLDETIESLRSQVLGLTASKEAQIANAAAALVTKAGLIDLTTANAEFVAQLEKFKKVSLELQQAQFADQLTKGNQALKIQIATMVEGKASADDLALSYEIANAKLGNMGDAARKAAKEQRELHKALAEAEIPQIKNTLESEQNLAEIKNKPGDISTNISGINTDALQKASDALDKIIADKFTSPVVKNLAINAKLEIEPQLDTSKLKTIKEQVLIDFESAERTADAVNKVFANSFDESAAKIESLKTQLANALKVDRGADKTPEAHDLVNKLSAQLDQKQLAKPFEDVDRELEIANVQAALLGRTFDLSGARVQVVQSHLAQMASGGLKSSVEEAKQLAEQLRNLKVADIFSNLQKNLEDIRADAEILGGAIDLPSESINALTEALKRLRAEGFKPLSPEIEVVKAQLEDAKAAEHFAQAFQDIGRSAIDALTDLADGAKIKDVAKRLASNINRAITDALITKPFEEWIKKQTNDLFGGFLKLPIPGAIPAGQSVGIPGAAGQIAGAASQTQPAIIAIQTVATEASAAIQTTGLTTQTSIQAVSTESMTGIQAGLGVAETTITTLGAATEASIAALQAVAITAIEAAGAANSVGSNGSNLASSIPLLGSLFSSGGAAADTGAQAVGGGLLALGYHRGGIIGHSPTFTRSVSLASSQNLPRFHSGGQMSHGGVKGTDLKPGERMIIAEDGEFVINKKTAMTIGADKLQKLNRAEATVTPRFHFGGMIREFSTGGLIDSNDIGSIPQWSSGRTDAPSSTTFQAGTIPQASLMLPGGSRGINNGPSANVAIFNNPQFQNRQSVGQASAQLAAAMESGKRNR